MGESTVIAHAILIIVSVVMASILAFVVLEKLNYVNSMFSEAIRNGAEAVGVKLLIVNAYRNQSTGMLYVYVKNIGTTAFTGFASIDLYIGNYSSVLDYYRYNSSASSPGTFNVTELGRTDGTWSPGETLRFNVDPLRTYGDIIEVKVVLPNGVTADEVLQIPSG